MSKEGKWEWDMSKEEKKQGCVTCKANGDWLRPNHDPRVHFSCGTTKKDLLTGRVQFKGWEALIDRPAEAQHLKVLVEVYEVLKKNKQPVLLQYFNNWCSQYGYTMMWSRDNYGNDQGRIRVIG